MLLTGNQLAAPKKIVSKKYIVKKYDLKTNKIIKIEEIDELLKNTKRYVKSERHVLEVYNYEHRINLKNKIKKVIMAKCDLEHELITYKNKQNDMEMKIEERNNKIRNYELKDKLLDLEKQKNKILKENFKKEKSSIMENINKFKSTLNEIILKDKSTSSSNMSMTSSCISW